MLNQHTSGEIVAGKHGAEQQVAGVPPGKFDGRQYHNLRFTYHSWKKKIHCALTRDRGPWHRWTFSPPGYPPPACVNDADLRVTFVNHATVLIQVAGLNILTDPVWSNRVGPIPWAGRRRRRAPGIEFDALPPIDVVLVSHNHYDHMDIPTLRRLMRAHGPEIVTAQGNRPYLTRRGIPCAAQLDWGESYRVSDTVVITAVPAQHNSGRGLGDENTALWAGFVIQTPSGNIFFAGDTGFGPHFKLIGDAFGPFRLALLPIGPQRPRRFMEDIHISPAQAVRAHKLLKANVSLAIHFGTFPLADDGEEEPVRELQQALDQADEPQSRFWVLGCGVGRDVPALNGGDIPQEGPSAARLFQQPAQAVLIDARPRFSWTRFREQRRARLQARSAVLEPITVS